MSENKFQYEWCMDFERDSLPAKMLKVKKIRFDISRYGEFSEVIEFPKTVSIDEAVKAVEEFLSQPLDEAYYMKIREDLFHEAPWEEAKEWFHTRGDCLTDCKFLEAVTEDKKEKGTFEIVCGS